MTVPPALLNRDFEAHQVTELRHAVSAAAATAGLAGEALDDFVLAVNELMTNAVRHGGGRGHLRLWLDGGELTCEVADRGGGIADGQLNGFERPAMDVPGGWGLWLVRRLSVDMRVRTGPDGTAVRIRAPRG